ncbi:hypothetical protein ACVW0K_000565 [Streptomyces filamentosus]
MANTSPADPLVAPASPSAPAVPMEPIAPTEPIGPTAPAPPRVLLLAQLSNSV